MLSVTAAAATCDQQSASSSKLPCSKMRSEAQMPYLHERLNIYKQQDKADVSRRQWSYLTVSAEGQAYEAWFSNHVLEGAFSAKLTISATYEAASSCTLRVEIVCISTRTDRHRKPNQEDTSFLFSRVA
jgi:hypothetical protein